MLITEDLFFLHLNITLMKFLKHGLKIVNHFNNIQNGRKKLIRF